MSGLCHDNFWHSVCVWRCGSTLRPGGSLGCLPSCCWLWTRWKGTTSAAFALWDSTTWTPCATLSWPLCAWALSSASFLSWLALSRSTTCVRSSSMTNATRRSWRSSWSASACSAASTWFLWSPCWPATRMSRAIVVPGREPGSVTAVRNIASPALLRYLVALIMITNMIIISSSDLINAFVALLKTDQNLVHLDKNFSVLFFLILFLISFRHVAKL